ncbi:tyrosine-type recombinase/integrase [Parabacteroides pacaensis]|uniref:tyrosine-type recombinase/integrase n=1 Tax=Parabacteroides pacaensis TaxID=2086575 RepID=UPI000D0FFA68|nr:tyrosine-type recombinase/integrase [Parabacteroides pacaensis]
MNIFSIIRSLFKENDSGSTELIPFIRFWLAHSKRDNTYKSRYYNLCNKLSNFEKHLSITLYTDSFSENMTESFIYYLQNNYKKKLLQNTIKKLISQLATMIGRAEKSGYKVNWGISEIRLKEDYIETVALTLDELDRINHLKLSKESSAIRDRFLIGCYTAQRISDYRRIKANDINNGILTIKQIKTGIVVKIPVHPILYEILERNGGEFPNLSSHQAINKTIKRICKKAGIIDIIPVERTRAGKIERLKFKKYEMISSHTARRTGATLMLLAGIPVAKIMKITGHTTELSFFQYIRIDKTKNAKELSEHPFFR